MLVTDNDVTQAFVEFSAVSRHAYYLQSVMHLILKQEAIDMVETAKAEYVSKSRQYSRQNTTADVTVEFWAVCFNMVALD